MSSLHSASPGAPPTAAAEPRRIRRAVPLPGADDPVVTSAPAPSTGATALPHVFPSVVEPVSTPVPETFTSDRAERATGDALGEGLPRAVPATGLPATAASSRPAGGQRVGGKPFLVAAAVAGAVLTSVPFVTHHGGTVNYEGLGQQAPVASQSPEAAGDGPLASPDGEASVMPLQDPARGTSAPVIPQPETASGTETGGASAEPQGPPLPGKDRPAATPDSPVTAPSHGDKDVLGPVTARGAALAPAASSPAAGASSPAPHRRSARTAVPSLAVAEEPETNAEPSVPSVPATRKPSADAPADRPRARPVTAARSTAGTASSAKPSPVRAAPVKASAAPVKATPAVRATPVKATPPRATTPAEPATSARTTRVVTGTTELSAGQSVASGRVRLTMRADGNLVIADEKGTVRWSSQTAGRGQKAVFQDDGNLVVYTADGRTAWSSGTAGHAGAKLVLQNDGNVTILSSGDALLWSANTQH